MILQKMRATLAVSLQDTQKGFTLIEMIIVIALMAISIGVSSDIILTLIKSYTKAQVGTEIEQNANFSSLKLEKELKTASAITAISGTSMIFTDKNGLAVTYAVVGGKLQRSVSGGTLIDITNNDAIGGVIVECSNITTNTTCDNTSPTCFKQLNTNPYTVLVNLAFKRKANPNDLDTIATVCTTVVMRGSY